LALRRATHKTIKAVTEALEGFRFNSAIARIYELVGELRAAKIETASTAVLAARAEALSVLARLVAPFAPHLAEECWSRLGEAGLVAAAPWPVYDPALTEDEEKVLPVQINGKRRGEIRAPAGASKDVVWELMRSDPDIGPKLAGATVIRFVHVPDRIANVVIQTA
jgi:leucyl-tRNA synthetase